MKHRYYIVEFWGDSLIHRKFKTLYAALAFRDICKNKGYEDFQYRFVIKIRYKQKDKK